MDTKMVSAQVPYKLAEKMKKYSFMNWSGFIRTIIERQVQLFESGENRILVDGEPVYTQTQ